VNSNYAGIPPWNCYPSEEYLGFPSEDFLDASTLEMFLDMEDNEIGMTEQRQESIQNALRNLMGHSKAGAITGITSIEDAGGIDPSAINISDFKKSDSINSDLSNKP
jgi:hypothetical protein